MTDTRCLTFAKSKIFSERMIYRVVSSWFSSNLSRCDSFVRDELFDIDIPDKIFVSPNRQHQELFATAHRCMNNWCFLKPARAYVLGLFVDHAALNRLRAHGPKIQTHEV